MEALQVLQAKIIGMMSVLDEKENYEHIRIFIWWIGIGCTTKPQALEPAAQPHSRLLGMQILTDERAMRGGLVIANNHNTPHACSVAGPVPVPVVAR